MIDIIPAIIVKSLSGIEEQLSHVRGVASVAQIDVVDGVFAKNVTWPYTDQDSFDKILSGDEGLPLWEDFDYQFDVMAVRPDRIVADLVAAGASGIVVHAASDGALRAVDGQQFPSGSWNRTFA